MGISVRQGGFVRSMLHAQVTKFSHGAGQATAYLTEAFGLGQLTKQHGYKMIPGAVALTITLGLVFYHEVVKHWPVKKGNQLTKDARTAYHSFVLLVVGSRFVLSTN